MKKKEKLDSYLESEEALKHVVERWDELHACIMKKGKPVLEFYDSPQGILIARLDIRKVIAKRAPLRGVQKELMKVVRSRPKKKKK